MPDSPKIWQVPDSTDYGKNGRRFEHFFWVLDDVATVPGLEIETMATGCLPPDSGAERTRVCPH